MELENRKYSIWDIIRIPFKCAPMESILASIKQLINGLVPIFEVMVTAAFLDTASLILKNQKEISDIIPIIILMGIFIAYNLASGQLQRFLDTKITNKLRQNLRGILIGKVATLDYGYIENQESSDLISRVIKEPEERFALAFKSLTEMVALAIKIIGILMIISVNVWWASLVVILISIPVLIFAYKGGEAVYEVGREVEKVKRYVDYLKEILNGRESVEEREVFGFTENINEKWHMKYEAARKAELKVDRKVFINMKSVGTVVTICSGIIVLILLYITYKGMMSIGLLISLTGTLLNLIMELAWLLPEYGSQLSKDKEYLVDLSNFVNLQGKKEYLDKPCDKVVELKSLEFKDVFFKYPNKENYILKGTSFKIEKGKHYAFVGINGAGKTTITKLITGLYDNFTGEILINGKSIREYTVAEIKSLSSVVYQDFAKYYISLEDNIKLGHVNEGNMEEKVKSSINVMGLNEAVDGLKDGVKTNLGKIKSDGMDLSGGQWQKLAMARAIVSPNTLKILDEPTAALDPVSESDIYENFEKISKGKTTIFISHRLGSTKLAHKIFVLEDGKVIEEGSFKELMEKGGVYTSMFNSQKSWYEK